MNYLMPQKKHLICVQMMRNVADLRHTVGLPDDADFLPLLDQSSIPLSKLPAQSITGMHYDSGRLYIDLKLRSETDIFALQRDLQNKGLSLRIGEIKNLGTAVETRIAIQTGGIL